MLMTILLCMPGSSFPKQNWLTEMRVDMWIHIFLFAVLVFMWRSSFDWRRNDMIVFSALLYGFIIEIVQYSWISNRSFEIIDLVCDLAGSVMGVLLWHWGYKKNKPL